MNKLVGLSLSLLLATAACGSQVVDFPVDKTTDNGDSAVDAGDDVSTVDGNVEAGDDVTSPSDDASDANVSSDDASDGSVSDDSSVSDASDSDGPIRGRTLPDSGVDSGKVDSGTTVDAGSHTDAGVCYHKSCTDTYTKCVAVCVKVSDCKSSEDHCVYECECNRSKCDESCGNTDCE